MARKAVTIEKAHDGKETLVHPTGTPFEDQRQEFHARPQSHTENAKVAEVWFIPMNSAEAKRRIYLAPASKPKAAKKKAA